MREHAGRQSAGTSILNQISFLVVSGQRQKGPYAELHTLDQRVRLLAKLRQTNFRCFFIGILRSLLPQSAVRFGGI